LHNIGEPGPLIGRDRFLDLNQTAYLYTGAHAPALACVSDALAWGHRCQSKGPQGRVDLFAAEERARASVGRLVGRAPADVGFLGDASTAWNQIANGLEWEPGDNVVLNEFEHPSVVYPFLRLKPRGLEVRVVARDDAWAVEPSAIEAACDERTRAIAVSHVGYVTGFRHDTGQIATVADRVGVPLFLDVSHSLGVVPVDVGDCAIAVGASYKWLLGPYGVGIVVWNRDRLPDFRPGAVGWRSTTDIFTDDRFERVSISDDARRFQLGAPSLGGIAALGAAVDELLTLSPAAVEDHAVTLSGRAIGALRELGLTVVTPDDPRRRAGNVAFLHPDGERVADELAARGVPVWGGDGRVRASFHVMNDGGAVDALRAALREVLAA
jgi:selenocysteine lyase/cysteine desulfurase